MALKSIAALLLQRLRKRPEQGCEVLHLDVAPSGYYKSLTQPLSNRAQVGAWLMRHNGLRAWQAWLLLAVVLDLVSRKVVGWATAPTIHLSRRRY